MDRWKTKPIVFEGGLILNEDALTQGITKPGSLIKAVNIEAGLNGGYRRINGFSKFDQTAVPGTGPVTGTFVFEDRVVACRSANIYTSTGQGTWTRINTLDDHSGALRYRATLYNWTTPTLILVDGIHAPAKYTPDEAVIYKTLAGAPVGAEFVVPFKHHLFFGKGSTITFSEPNDDEGYVATDGAGEFVSSGRITGMAVWRDDLFIFHETSIERLTGTSSADFALVPVTNNIGCIAPDSVQEVNGDIAYLSGDGIRTIAGTARIGDVELASISRQVQSIANEIKVTATGAGYISSLVLRNKSQYRIFPTNSFILEPLVRGMIGCLRQNSQGALGWEWFETVGINVSCCHSGYFLGRELAVHGSWNGYVYRHDDGSNFDGASIVSVMQTAYAAYDDPEIRKTMYKLTAYAEVEGNTAVNVSTSYDFEDHSISGDPIGFGTESSGTTLYDLSSSVYDDPLAIYDANPSPKMKGDLAGSGFTVSFSFYSDGVLPSYSIKSIVVQYTIGGRR